MGLPQMERCCFLFDLKTGNIILGGINAFLSFGMFLIFVMEAVALDTLENNLEGPVDVEVRAALTGLYAMIIILILMFLAKFCFDVFYLYGVTRERPGIIKAYFVMCLVFFLLSMFIFFINAPKFTAGTVCSELLYIGLNVYVILLSYSYYKQLNTREEV